VYDVQNVTLSKPADKSLRTRDLESYFRDTAMDKLGYGANRSGVAAYVEHNRTKFNTRWTYAAFFTKYPVQHFACAYLGGPFMVTDAGYPIISIASSPTRAAASSACPTSTGRADAIAADRMTLEVHPAPDANLAQKAVAWTA
jgi:hypothetical protein